MSFPDPSVTVPNFAPYLFCFGGLGFGGLTLPSIGQGGDFQLLGATGLGMPPVRAGDVPRPRDQGQFAGLNLLDGRDPTFDLGVIPWSYATAWDARQALATAFSPGVLTETPLYYRPPSAESNAPTLVCMARCTKFDWPLDTLALQGHPPTFESAAAAGGGMYHVAAQFHATDARWYAAPSTATGPVTPGNSTTINNTGSYEMRPVLVITGPCTSPAIANNTLAATITFHDPSNPSPYDLLAGDYLTVDLDSHAVTKYVASSATTISVPNWQVTGSVWWNLVPGNNVIAFSAAASAAGVGLTIKWAPAYLTA